MRNLIILILIVIGLTIAINVDATRFDWRFGRPGLIVDEANTDQWEWHFGRPEITYEYQEAAPAAPEQQMDVIIISMFWEIFNIVNIA